MAKKKGLWIPEELLRNEELTLTEIFILSTVISLCGKEGCFAKNDHISEVCRCTGEMVSRTIRKGEKMGYITVKRNGKYGRIIQSQLTVESIHNDRTINTNRPYDQHQLTVESIGNENLPIISNNKTFNKTFYYSARTREEEQGSEKIRNIPTEEDVGRYCAEMGYSWEVKKFVRYNTARGWTVGGQPCADWRALADMWTDRDSEDDGAAEGSFDTDEFFQAALKRSREEVFGG